MRATIVALLTPFGSGTAVAQDMIGDPAAGEAHFAERCVSCHVIKSEAGEVLVGGGSINLFGVAGRVPGSLPLVSYSNPMTSYGETGAVWEEANFVAFVPDPSGFLREALGLPESKMPISRRPTGVIRDEQAAHDLWAYLATFSPAEGEGAQRETSTTGPAVGKTVSE